MLTGLRTSGGEGGIRTLDRVVRPYNGLAKLSRPGAYCSDSTIYVGVVRPFSGCHGLVRAQLCSKSAPRWHRYWKAKVLWGFLGPRERRFRLALLIKRDGNTRKGFYSVGSNGFRRRSGLRQITLQCADGKT